VLLGVIRVKGVRDVLWHLLKVVIDAGAEDTG